jgi:spore germination cell wall hydrolase CwlJ-like protein
MAETNRLLKIIAVLLLGILIMTALVVKVNIITTDEIKSTPAGITTSEYVVPKDLYYTPKGMVVVPFIPAMSAGEQIFNNEYSKYLDVNMRELAALTVTLYGEARGESSYGVAAVADTIRNRMRSRLFPNTYYGVVTQPYQFSCIHNRTDLFANIKVLNNIDKRDLIRLVSVAHRTINGSMKKMTYNALFYHATNIHPKWADDYNELGKVGHHVFYTTIYDNKL